jgi:hypothetical protein
LAGARHGPDRSRALSGKRDRPCRSSCNFSLLDTTYHHDYSPGVYNNTTVTELDSLVNQHVNIKGKGNLGAEFKANVFLGKEIGIQFLADFHRTRLTGTDNFSYMHLIFKYYDWPSVDPARIAKDTWISMKDTEGQIDQKTLCLNIVSRILLARGLHLDLSAGASLFLYSGKAQPIGYIHHTFSHFIFCSIPYNFDFSIPATAALGFNVGEDMKIALGPHAFAFIGCRYYKSFAGSSEIKLVSDLNSSIPDPEWVETAQERLDLEPLKLKPSFFSTKVGLGIEF